MSNSELAFMDIATLAPLLERRQVSPVELMESQLVLEWILFLPIRLIQLVGIV